MGLGFTTCEAQEDQEGLLDIAILVTSTLDLSIMKINGVD
jgi:hypothetical protein